MGISDKFFDLERRLNKLETRLQNLLQPAQQMEPTAERATATARFSYVGAGLASNVPLLQQYGVYSRPLANALHLVVNVGGYVGRGISIASNDERYRPIDLLPGDVCMADSSGQRMQLTGGTSIIMAAGQTVIVTAPAGVTITTPLVTINGALHVTGDVTAGAEPVSVVSHTHRSYGANSVTTAPL